MWLYWRIKSQHHVIDTLYNVVHLSQKEQKIKSNNIRDNILVLKVHSVQKNDAKERCRVAVELISQTGQYIHCSRLLLNGSQWLCSINSWILLQFTKTKHLEIKGSIRENQDQDECEGCPNLLS